MPESSISRRPPLLHVAQLVFNTPLLVLPEKLETVLAALGPRLAVDPASLRDLRQSGLFHGRPRLTWDDDEDDDDSPESNSGKKPYTVTQSGIAIIPVQGILMKKGGWMSALSGCSSYEGIGKAVSQAVSDASVTGLLLNIDSPGGTTHGCFELTDQIFKLRGKKPIFSVANDLAASAAYSIASATDRIFLTRTAGVGSVGVFCLHTETSALDAEIGVKYTYIFAGDRKVDGNQHEPLSSTARSSLQAEIDREYAIFTRTVARNRSTTIKAVTETQARVYFADNSIPLLADAVGTYDDALADLTSKATRGSVMMPLNSGSHGNSGIVQGVTEMPVEKQSVDTLRANALVAQKAVEEAEAAEKAEKAKQAAAPAQTEPNPPAQILMVERIHYTPSRRALVADPIRSVKTVGKSDPMDDGDSCDNPNHPEGCNHGEGYDSKRKAAQMPPPAPAPPAPPALRVDVSNDAAVEIAELCAIAGHPEMVVKFLSDRKTVAEARKALAELRATESTRTAVQSYFGAVSTDSLDQIQTAVESLVANSGGSLSRSKAMEKVLRSNPRLYKQYDNERTVAALTPMGMEAYVTAIVPRFAAMGLGTNVGEHPAAG